MNPRAQQIPEAVSVFRSGLCGACFLACAILLSGCGEDLPTPPDGATYPRGGIYVVTDPESELLAVVPEPLHERSWYLVGERGDDGLPTSVNQIVLIRDRTQDFILSVSATENSIGWSDSLGNAVEIGFDGQGEIVSTSLFIGETRDHIELGSMDATKSGFSSSGQLQAHGAAVSNRRLHLTCGLGTGLGPSGVKLLAQVDYRTVSGEFRPYLFRPTPVPGQPGYYRLKVHPRLRHLDGARCPNAAALGRLTHPYNVYGTAGVSMLAAHLCEVTVAMGFVSGGLAWVPAIAACAQHAYFVYQNVVGLWDALQHIDCDEALEYYLDDLEAESKIRFSAIVNGDRFQAEFDQEIEDTNELLVWELPLARGYVATSGVSWPHDMPIAQLDVITACYGSEDRIRVRPTPIVAGHHLETGNPITNAIGPSGRTVVRTYELQPCMRYQLEVEQLGSGGSTLVSREHVATGNPLALDLRVAFVSSRANVGGIQIAGVFRLDPWSGFIETPGGIGITKEEAPEEGWRRISIASGTHSTRGAEANFTCTDDAFAVNFSVRGRQRYRFPGCVNPGGDTIAGTVNLSLVRQDASGYELTIDFDPDPCRDAPDAEPCERRCDSIDSGEITRVSLPLDAVAIEFR